MHGQDSRMHGLIILLRVSRSEMIPSASLRKLRLPNLIKTLLLHMNAILSKLDCFLLTAVQCAPYSEFIRTS